MIQVESLVFEYPAKRVLHEVSFRIRPGSVTALVGPNGAGKSTLMRCMAALYRPFSGRVVINGFDSQEHPCQVHHSIGYLSDFFGLYDELSVSRSLEYACRTHEVPLGRIEQVAVQLGLSSYLQTPAGHLSRGLRQRLAIGLALIHQPKVLLLDEPASGLDPEARASLSRLFLMLRDQGMTLVVSSHILSELEDYASEVLILGNGHLLEHHAVTGGVRQTVIDLRLSRPEADLALRLAGFAGLEVVQAQAQSARITFAGDDGQRAELLAQLVAQGLPICSFASARSDLQEVYRKRMGSSETGVAG